MKKYFFPAAFFSMALFLAGGLNAQIDQMARDCQAEMETPFITSNKTLKAFLTGEEVAEFRTTLFDGNIYRVVLCTPEAQAVAFSLYDTNRNLLYTSSDHSFSPSWDFKMEGSMECIIEARLNNKVSESGVAMLLIGFKHNDQN